ncbi:MAG: lysine--tRNA ligase [Deltaproteobacteria bacterium]|nr:lysine--tRNA ligase [Deltaproteobacteria bacterium]
MADENELMAERQRKADELRAAGLNPYANGWTPTHDVGQLIERFGATAPEGYEHPADKTAPPKLLSEDRFAIAGRIIAYRGFGRATFVKLRDRTGSMQAWLKADVLPEGMYDVFKKMERGDFIGVTGVCMFTKTGELTLLAESFTVLTKATRPLPEKWHGLQDVELRYRQRYVDLIVNDEVREVFKKRTKIISAIRRFFDTRDFMEVETPMMHSVLGGAAARPFSTHHNALDMDLYMRIAPELFLKRLVVGGFDRVYEIGRNFRNEGLSRKHNPEFTMLEFYQAYATFEDLMELTEELIAELAREVRGNESLVYEGRTVDLSRPWPRLPMKDAIVTASKQGMLPPGLDRPVLDDEAALLAWIESHGITNRKDELGQVLRKCENHGERVGALFDYGGELALPFDRPVFVYDYPAETSPLSRRNDDEPAKVDRFELFIVGREHANGFSELNDPVDQRQRFAKQQDAKARGADETMDYDEDYCRALEYGLPPTAGEGIGIDRLVMLLCDQPSIRDVILFPLMRPEL